MVTARTGQTGQGQFAGLCSLQMQQVQSAQSKPGVKLTAPDDIRPSANQPLRSTRLDDIAFERRHLPLRRLEVRNLDRLSYPGNLSHGIQNGIGGLYGWASYLADCFEGSRGNFRRALLKS